MGGNDEYATAKYISKRMKAKGLQKLRFYCQVCHKQCRDANGFNSHTKSKSHLNKILEVTENDIDRYTAQFQHDFLQLLRLNHGEKYIAANKFYNEFIQDRDHVHMNATKFTSLSKFVKHLSTNGLVRVKLETSVNDGEEKDLLGEIDMGSLLISYIDRSNESVLHKQKIKELEATERTEREIQNYLLQRQIGKHREKHERKEGEGRKDDNTGEEKNLQEQESAEMISDTSEVLGGVKVNLRLGSKASSSSTSTMISRNKIRKRRKIGPTSSSIVFK